MSFPFVRVPANQSAGVGEFRELQVNSIAKTIILARSGFLCLCLACVCLCVILAARLNVQIRKRTKESNEWKIHKR